MSSNIKKPNEDKLEILKSIIDERPFGFTLMEIYKDYKERHGIGSRNTLKNYLNILLERKQIKKVVIGNYKVFRTLKDFSMKKLFNDHPILEKKIINFFSALTIALQDDLESNGERIGRELINTSPIKKNILIKKFKKIPILNKKETFQILLSKIKEGQGMPFHDKTEVIVNDDEAIITIKDSKLLRKKAWIFYYIQVGALKFLLEEILNQSISIKIKSITEIECKIHLKIKN
ncbi:MAG: hypothetical protein ACTSVY_13555 [Candidatus Helarchaeota archaeon]